jgi:flagellar M-ring protein FliF
MSSELALPAPASDTVRPGLGAVMERVRHVAAQPAVAKSLPMLGLVALLGLAALVWMTMSRPPQRDLFHGLADGDKAAVADALKVANIAYSIDRDTGALSVSDGDFYQAKMLLAQQGLPKSAPDGDAMISSLPLGASRAVEGERLRGARELDLARTIEAIDAVESAKVHLAVEQPSVFLRDRAEPAASVMLRLHAGRTLGDSQVQAIVHLVASSVPGLSPDGVSVVDQTGRLLSRVGGQADGGASDRQVEIQARIEARYQEALTKLLTPLVGADNFAAEVHADLDFAEVQATRESYPKDLAGLRAEQGTVTSGEAGGPNETGGIPGALSNQPPPSAQPSATPPGAPAAAGAPAATPAPAGPKTENYNRTFELGREVSVTKQPVGQVKRLTIAVALKQGGTRRTAKELAEIEQLVRNAVGFDAARGDTIALSARKFADPAEPGANGPKWWEASWVSLLARNLSALLIAALVLFGVAKPLLKRRPAGIDLPAPVRAARKAEIGTEIAAAIAHEARHDPNRPVTLDMIEAAPGYANRAALIRNFVRQDPARAALVVRDLIRSDMPGGEERDG